MESKKKNLNENSLNKDSRNKDSRNKVLRNQNINKSKKAKVNFFPVIVLIIGFIIGVYFYINMTEPSKVVKKYFQLLNDGKYDEMYDCVSTSYSKEEFINRVKNIYEGINASNINITIIANSSETSNTNSSAKIDNSSETSNTNNTITVDNSSETSNTNNTITVDNSSETSSTNNSSTMNNYGKNNSINDGLTKVSYNNSMNTVAGYVSFKNSIYVKNEDGKYLIDWNSSAIFPDLDEDEKIKVKTNSYTRGTIFDRNNKIIAKDGEAYSVGLVKNKVNKSTDLSHLANLLKISTDTINEKLNQNYSSDNVFIELKKISKEEQDLKLELLKINGVMITDVSSRIYPYKEALSSITGYIQDNQGKAGIELALNDKLSGEDGKEIYIDKNGYKVKTIAEKKVKNGDDVKLTIDAEEQKNIYETFKEDKGAYVKINYKTGEILALVSTPSYDANLFSLGISDEEWENLKNNENKILYNRCFTTYTPGSTMKPIIGAIGLETNSFTADEDFGKSNLKWQKDTSWGNFYVTTLKKYDEEANLENALVYSDNIYFAKAALKIGKDNLKSNLDKLGFNEKMDFIEDIPVSTYGNLDSEKTIANTGYGQGDVLVNPILMASIYSSFANEGNMCKPYIIYEDNSENKTKILKQNVIKSETANEIKLDLLEVVKRGTAQEIYTEDKNYYGKTGTAEIKSSQDDENGTENGWFAVFDDDGNLYISICEDVKNKGESHYVVSKMKSILK